MQITNAIQAAVAGGAIFGLAGVGALLVQRGWERTGTAAIGGSIVVLIVLWSLSL